MARIVKAARPSPLTASDRARMAAPVIGPRNRLPVVRVLRWIGVACAVIIAASHVYRFMA